jgi:hypothetical protein
VLHLERLNLASKCNVPKIASNFVHNLRKSAQIRTFMRICSLFPGAIQRAGSKAYGSFLMFPRECAGNRDGVFQEIVTGFSGKVGSAPALGTRRAGVGALPLLHLRSGGNREMRRINCSGARQFPDLEKNPESPPHTC